MAGTWGIPRRGPFSRQYHEWLPILRQAKPGYTEVCVFLLLCEVLQFDDRGNAYASIPRAKLAQELGITESAVKQAVQGLKDKGLICDSDTGTRGHAAEYVVMPGIPWPEKDADAGPPAPHGRAGRTGIQ